VRDHGHESSRSRPRVGFIGLGTMGRPMARRVVEAGYPLRVYVRSEAAWDRLDGLAAERHSSPAGLAEASDVILTMLPEARDLQEILTNESGLLQGLVAGTVLLDMGTHDPESSRRFEKLAAARGAWFLDAPVSGGELGATDGTLAIMVGGAEAAFELALPVLRAMGTTIVRMGATGAGQITKACNQLVVGSTIEAVAEALVLAARAGVDPAKVREVLAGGYAASRVLDVHGARMLRHDFQPGGRSELHLKDARIVLSLARSLGVPIPGFAPVARAFRSLVACRRGHLDHAALVTLLEDRSGVVLAAGGDHGAT
jgi:2-hydroxy-3-oxopropionate reductase